MSASARIKISEAEIYRIRAVLHSCNNGFR